MLKHIITLLAFCCLTSPAIAADVKLRDNHPDKHVVVKGDTLWGISAKFLKDPWQWPKVWKMNREQIKNPHLIYPGDVVVLDTSNGSPEFRLLRETVSLQPGVRVEPLEKEAIPTIQPNIIAPFLSQPLIIESDGLKDAVSIVSGQENRVILGPGVRFYADRIEEGDGIFWNIYRDGKTLVDPVTKETLGTEAFYLGEAKVSKYGEPATAEIVRAKEEIFVGDKLIPAPEVLPTTFVPRAPDNNMEGLIIANYNGVNEAGVNSIVTINRGSSDGLEQGHVLAIYRDRGAVRNPKFKKTKTTWKDRNPNYLKELEIDRIRATEKKPGNSTGKEDVAQEADASIIRLPNERVGLLLIFRTFERVSYGLIVQSEQPINVLDIVQTPQ